MITNIGAIIVNYHTILEYGKYNGDGWVSFDMGGFICELERKFREWDVERLESVLRNRVLKVKNRTDLIPNFPFRFISAMFTKFHLT